jgi:hypothetical protein
MYQREGASLFIPLGANTIEEEDMMLPYGKIRAMHDARVTRYVTEQERAMARKVRKYRSAGLAELLNSLAQGLAAIGIQGGSGNRRPAAPGY